jgi:hypothetical protein
MLKVRRDTDFTLAVLIFAFLAGMALIIWASNSGGGIDTTNQAQVTCIKEHGDWHNDPYPGNCTFPGAKK